MSSSSPSATPGGRGGPGRYYGWWIVLGAMLAQFALAGSLAIFLSRQPPPKVPPVEVRATESRGRATGADPAPAA